MRNSLIATTLIMLSCVAVISAATMNHSDRAKQKATVQEPPVTINEKAAPRPRLSIQSNITVAWKNKETGAMMMRTLTDEQVQEVKALMLSGHTQDEALLSIEGPVTVAKVPQNHKPHKDLAE